jgi:hypothetical protein
MVNVVKITQLLNHYFDIGGNIQIDPITGVVDVRDGGVRLLRDNRIEQLPVQFGRVDGLFLCSGNQLTTLEGSPQHVGVLFHCDHNKLTDLKGAPTQVGGGFWCSNNMLTSLQGAPDHVGGSLQCNGNPLKSLDGMPSVLKGQIWLDYDAHLPLLRLLEASGFVLSFAPDQVKNILNKYTGKGKSHMLNLALELKQAGYVGNAAW